MPAFVHRLRVRYSECDPQNHVFNANYLNFFDIALTELWRKAIGSYGAMTTAGVDMVVAEAIVRYRAPARFDDELDVALVVRRLGRTSMASAIEITRGDEQIVDGDMRHVFIDLGSGRPVPIPDRVREGLAAFATTK